MVIPVLPWETPGTNVAARVAKQAACAAAHQLVGGDDHLGDVRGHDVAAADHVLGIVMRQPGVRGELRAVVGVVGALPRHDRVIDLRVAHQGFNLTNARFWILRLEGSRSQPDVSASSAMQNV